MPRILIDVPGDRRIAASLRLLDDAEQVIAGPFDACVKSDGLTAEARANAQRDPLLPFGDTPLGTYEINGYQACPPGDSEERGPIDRIRLTPQSGDAMTAAFNGRIGFQIHGGRIGDSGRLRPTLGSIRLSDADMNALLRAVASHGTANLPVTCEIRPAAALERVQGIADDVGLEGEDPAPDLVRPVANAPTNPPPSPFIASFTADPTDVMRTRTTTLQWQTVFAAQVELNGEIVAESGSVQHIPVRNTSFTLTASGVGPETKSATTVVRLRRYDRHHERGPFPL